MENRKRRLIDKNIFVNVWNSIFLSLASYMYGQVDVYEGPAVIALPRMKRRFH